MRWNLSLPSPTYFSSSERTTTPPMKSFRKKRSPRIPSRATTSAESSAKSKRCSTASNSSICGSRTKPVRGINPPTGSTHREPVFRLDARSVRRFCPFSVSCRFRHDLLDLGRVAGQTLAQQLVAGAGNQHVVLNPHAQVFFRDVDARLHRHHHPRLERLAVRAGVVHVEADVVSEPVNVVGTKLVSMQVSSVRIDVVKRNFVHALVARFAQIHSRLER